MRPESGAANCSAATFRRLLYEILFAAVLVGRPAKLSRGRILDAEFAAITFRKGCKHSFIPGGNKRIHQKVADG